MFKDATGFTHIYLRCGATDMRCGINNLLGIIEGSMGLNATKEGSIFLFCGKRRDRIKAVIFERRRAGCYVTKYLAVTVTISGQSIEDLLLISCEFDRIVRPDKFKTDELYNIHFSMLPKYKACAPVKLYQGPGINY